MYEFTFRKLDLSVNRRYNLFVPKNCDIFFIDKRKGAFSNMTDNYRKYSNQLAGIGLQHLTQDANSFWRDIAMELLSNPDVETGYFAINHSTKQYEFLGKDWNTIAKQLDGKIAATSSDGIDTVFINA